MAEWRTLDWLPGYEISEHGDVRRTVRQRSQPAGELLKAEMHKGYTRYRLTDGQGRYRRVAAHRLVCEAWHGPAPEGKTDAAHYNGARSDNHYSNLRWATRLENNADQRLHGTLTTGERNSQAKLDRKNAIVILAKFESGRFTVAGLADEHGVGTGVIYRLVRGESYLAERASA